METKRGCEFACSFCAEPAKHERYRLRESRLVVDEIEAALSRGINRISFVDGIFNYPTDHAIAVCEEILRRDLDVRWSVSLTPAGLTTEMLDLVKRAGCTDVSLGIDAGSATMLGVYRKAFTVDDARAAFDLLAQTGLGFATGVLFGGPGETVETVDQTITFLESLPPPRFVSLNPGIRIYAGTALEPLARADGWAKGEGGITAPRYYMSSALPQDMADRLDDLSRAHPNWYTPRTLRERFGG